MKKLLIAFSIVSVFLLVFSSGVAAAPPVKVRVIIGFDRAPGPDEEALVRSFGGDVKCTYRIIPAIAASIPETAIQGLLRNPKVTIIEPDITIQAVETEYPWGVVKIGADIVQKSGNTGAGVKVAILDSGIDYNHPDLKAAYVDGYDFVNGDDDPMDDHGHGTHVAGTIAAQANGFGVVGVAPGVEIYALKILDKNGSGSFSNVILALEWATGGSSLPGSIKVDITNNSYGASGNPGSLTQMAFDLAYYSDGVLNIAAAGNSGSGTDTVIYPAKYESVVAVAATDLNNVRASFSSTGPDVELAAPGVGVNSTIPGGGYASWNGTSMATPHVVGVAALVKAANYSLTNAKIRARLQLTADDLGDAGKDNLYGFGLVDADEAAGVAPVNHPPIADAGGPYTGEVSVPITFNGAGSSDPDKDLLTYSWDFGDGSTATVVSPTHAYTLAGMYTATLTVSDGTLSASDTASVTVTASTLPKMHVARIEVTTRTQRVGKTNYYIATATVKVVAEDNTTSVPGVTVSGHWSGLAIDVDTGNTDSNGLVAFDSNRTKKTSGTFTFTVDNLVKPGWEFAPSSPSSGSKTIP